MTWPPPPPSSDPWATDPEPGNDAEQDTSAELPLEPPADPGWEPEPVTEPAADLEPVDPEPEPAPEPEPHDPAPPIDAGYTAEAEYFPQAPPSFEASPYEPPPHIPLQPGLQADSGWSSFSQAPPPVIPRPQVPPPPSKKPLWLAVAAVAGVLVVGLVIWLLLPSGGDDPTPSAATTSATPTVDAEAEATLLGLIPAGYGAGICEATTAPTGARAATSCGPNTDPGGPASSTYTIAEDGPALDAAFDAVVSGSTRVNCPGNIQSPGPWRRNASPQKVSGVLFCGFQQNRPVVAWTNIDESLVAVAEAGLQGPDLDQLYLWWSSHS